ncbi:MAG: nitrogen fixation protein NifZ [Rivihabitans pingtungensis]
MCAEDLFNDGGMPGADEDAILAPAGARGVVVQSGYAEEDESQMIYLVR